MSRPSLACRLAIRLARFIAGSARREWINAMAAEIDAADSGQAAWAWGCVGAALRDRLRRDWLFLLALLLTPPLAMIWSMAFFFATAQAFRALHMTSAARLGLQLILPLIFPALLASAYPRRALLMGVATALLYAMLPALIMYALFGIPITAWLANAKYLTFGAALYFPLQIGLWLATAIIAARLAQHRRNIPEN